MALVNLTLDTLGDLANGETALLIDKALAVAFRDIEDRGQDKEHRKVVITVDLAQKENGEIDAFVQVKTEVPKYRTHATTCLLKHQGDDVRIAFQSHNAENPSQGTLDEMYKKEDEE